MAMQQGMKERCLIIHYLYRSSDHKVVLAIALPFAVTVLGSLFIIQDVLATKAFKPGRLFR